MRAAAPRLRIGVPGGGQDIVDLAVDERPRSLVERFEGGLRVVPRRLEIGDAGDGAGDMIGSSGGWSCVGVVESPSDL
jgi:hypothetical protein